MGARGPIRNRDADLARDRSRKGSEYHEATKAKGNAAEPPEPNPDWTDVSMMLWEAAKDSGFKRFFQATDWAAAWLLVDEIDTYRTKSPIMIPDPDNPKKRIQATNDDGEPLFYPHHKMSGQMFQTLWSALGSLGYTEGDRRRMGIELTNTEDEDGPDAQILSIVGDQFADLGM